MNQNNHMNQACPDLFGSSDNYANEENRVFNHSGLIIYCYLLIPVNELRVKSKIVN